MMREEIMHEEKMDSDDVGYSAERMRIESGFGA